MRAYVSEMLGDSYLRRDLLPLSKPAIGSIVIDEVQIARIA